MAVPKISPALRQALKRAEKGEATIQDFKLIEKAIKEAQEDYFRRFEKCLQQARQHGQVAKERLKEIRRSLSI